MRPDRTRDDGGSVVAEFAIALPAIVLVLLLGVGTLAAGGRHVVLQDAASDAARLLARGESDAAAAAVVARAESSASVEVQRTADLVCVVASAPAGIGAITLSARSCALAGGL